MSDFTKITFLLGSGISNPSEMPDVKKITDALLEENRLKKHDESERSIPLYHPASSDFYPIKEEATRSFVILLKSFCDQHLVLRGMDTANYEDVYYLGKQIHDYVNGEYDNPALLPYFSELKLQISMLESSLNTKYNRNKTTRPCGHNR